MISDILGFSMDPMGTPWDPMGTPWDPMGTHGNPWEPMGPMDFPWIFHELSGRPEADKKCGGGGSPPHEEANVPKEANVHEEANAHPSSSKSHPRPIPNPPQTHAKLTPRTDIKPTKTLRGSKKIISFVYPGGCTPDWTKKIKV